MKSFFALAALLSAVLLSACSSLPSVRNATDTASSASAPSTTTARWDDATPAADPQPPTGPMRPLSASRIQVTPVTLTEPPRDLWDRIRRGFAMPDLDNDLVRDREKYYATRPDYLARMTERSRKYLFHIVEELERRNMPTELALLPFIESAFNPQAMSTAKAAGMWQFVPATGRNFELKQSVFRDDRRDVLASTRAALDYLQKLYNMFGDWQLALAAYNWGEGSVSRAIAKNQRAGLATSYSDLNMPAETRMYVPKLQAMKNLIAQPEAFSASLPEIYNHPYFQTVVITRDIDVAVAARLAEIREEDFVALNPSANRPVILAAGTPQILLPWDSAAVFVVNLQSYSGQLASWTAWTAPATMKLADAAAKVGMSEATLRQVNHIPPRMLVKAGSTLLVHRAVAHTKDVTDHVADNARIDLAPEVVTKRITVKAGKHDTLASLAKRHNVSVASIAEWNKLSASSSLKVGQSVVLHVASSGGNRHVARSGRAAPSRSVAKRGAPHRAAPPQRTSAPAAKALRVALKH